MKNFNKLNYVFILIAFFVSGCFGGSDSESNTGTSSKTETNSQNDDNKSDDSTNGTLSLTYDERAEFLILYTNCINCHDNNNGMDFSSADNAISDVESAYANDSIDSSSEEGDVDVAIQALVDLYKPEEGGTPFSRTGEDASGTNMSDKGGIEHSDIEKENIDKLESWIVQEM